MRRQSCPPASPVALRSAFGFAWLAASTLALGCSGSIDDAPTTPSSSNTPPASTPSATPPSAPASTPPATSPSPPASTPSTASSTTPQSTPSASSPTPSSTPPATPGNGTPAASDEISFQTDIRPIFLASCSTCHASGSLPNFASPDADASYRVAARESEEILEVLEEGEMPLGTCGGGAPGASGCVSLADFQLVSDWVEAGAPK